MRTRIGRAASLPRHSLFRLQSYGQHESLQRKHFYLFYDLNRTFQRDRMLVIDEYDIAKYPEVLELIKATIPHLGSEDALTLVLRHAKKIFSAQDALTIFDLLFPEEVSEKDADKRLDYAYAIMPAITEKRELKSLLSRLGKQDRIGYEMDFDLKSLSAYTRHT